MKRGKRERGGEIGRGGKGGREEENKRGRGREREDGDVVIMLMTCTLFCAVLCSPEAISQQSTPMISPSRPATRATPT